MKQRRISIKVVTVYNECLFEKDSCSPQDVISVLSLFGDDGIRFHIAIDDIEVSVPASQD